MDGLPVARTESPRSAARFMSDFFIIILELLVIAALVLANGFFVAAEFALVKVRASQLRPLAATGGRRVRFALLATEHLDAALSACQLGITLASLGLGWIGEPFLAHRLEPLFSEVGVTDPALISSISFAVAFTLITALHIIFGELAPKSLAIQRARGVALRVSAPLMVFYYVFFPFIWLLNGAANLFLRWVGLGPATDAEHAFSSDELEYLFSHAHHSHPADALVNKLMVQSLRVRRTTAQQIMLPKEQIVALWLDKHPSENLRIAQTTGYSRYPVCTGTLLEVKGILLVREWLWQIQALGIEASFAPLIKPALTFELTTTVPAMIERFRAARSHLAIVLDEHKTMAGIVAFEDVLEEIVGDIRDEFDLELGPVFERAPSSIVVSGQLTMRELQAETGWPFDWQARETVGGWMQRHCGHAPRRDEAVGVREYRLTALEVNAERVRRVRVERINPDDAPAAQ